MNTYPNNTINKLQSFDYLTKEECDLLFIDKSSWDSEDSHFNDAKEFWSIFSKIKDILKDTKNRNYLKLSPNDSYYNFTYIKFPDMDSSPIYEEYIHPISYCDNGEDENDGYEYLEDTDFSYCIFFGKANFKNATFENEVKFNYAVFKDTAEFSEVTFEADTFFNNCTFQKFISFENSECSNIFDFSDVAFSSLLLDKSNFPHASYLRLDGWNKNINEDIARERLSAKHFKTKETARIIKAYFEKQNNIIESNIYYPIEMEKYREEISEYLNPFIAFFINQDYLVTTLSKYVSNYNTSWIRVLFWILFFSLITLLFHDGLPSDKTTLLNIPHRAMELINPLNIFKKDYDLYKSHEFWAMIVRVITIYLFYQFAMAFRQNTRRK